jgi:hypothetical protein
MSAPGYVKLDVTIRSDSLGDFRENEWRVVTWCGCPEHQAVVALLVRRDDPGLPPTQCVAESAQEMLTRLELLPGDQDTWVPE